LSADPHALTEAARRVRAAQRLAVLTGAGISAESGVPTFRDAQTGLWSKFDPMQLASPEGFRRDPALVWRWYAWRRELVARAAPNAAHFALARAARDGVGLVLATQNVDGLHARAGSVPVLELHGNILRTKCLEGCGQTFDDPSTLPSGEPPRGPGCGAWLRPDVVWFGEMLDADVLGQSEQAAAGCDVMLVVGTSGLVYPAAGLPQMASAHGACVIVVNPQSSELDGLADVRIRGPAGQVVPALFGFREV
jgi:NAD-dependent deacetylase